ncbi:MAG: hypothetical protein H6R11_1021 [Proteobacteria bacterium]|jgi:hypothetical protein|nr:hypothetical protein [Pseudomonadota bacterium]
MATATGTKPWGKFALFGVASAICYGWLFLHLNDKEMMVLFTRKEGLFPLLPVIAAFVFSLFHGNFTGYFWDVVGIQAKAHKPQPVVEEIIDEAEGSED